MKATRSVLWAALAAAGLCLAVDVQAQEKHGTGARGGHWSGGHGGHWNGGPWSGGHRWYGGRYWGPRVGFYFGAPLFWGSYYWGWPYDYDYYPYPRTYVYREIERVPADGVAPADTTQVAPGEGAPTQGPLYMNYCESAKAYFPKVTKCPEGWRLATPTR